VVRVIVFWGVMVLTIFSSAFAVRAVLTVEAAAAPHFQDPGYPGPDDSGDPNSYPYPEPGQGNTPTSTLPVQSTPVSTITITLTPTSPPDIFRTEDAEIGDTLVTPSGEETPAPTHTPINTNTPTPTVTATPEPTPIPAVEEEGFQLDWGLFSIGFAIPILVGSGVVLYYIDRRPDFFARRPRQ
jgi:hypothetical protein